MQEPSEEERLRRLADRLAELRRAQDPAPPAPEHHTQAQLAWRMVTELVAGLLVGFGIGYGLDALFGTRPWLLVLFTLLGFAAGVQTMMRTARELPGAAAQGGGPQPARGATGRQPAPHAGARDTSAPHAGAKDRSAPHAGDGDTAAPDADRRDRPAPGAGEGQREDARRG